jgi:hypothetical protein
MIMTMDSFFDLVKNAKIGTKIYCNQFRLKSLFESKELFKISVLRKGSFSRPSAGKLTFSEALFTNLDLCSYTYQVRMDKNPILAAKGLQMTEQGYSNLRNNYNELPFVIGNEVVMKNNYSGEYSAKTYKGFYVLVEDGSYVKLPKSEEIVKEFGTRGSSKKCPMGGVSALVDVLNNYVPVATLTHSDMNERTELKKHIEWLGAKLPHIAKKSIILLDRGYPSLELLKTLAEAGNKFIIRCSKKGPVEINKSPIGMNKVTLRNGITLEVVKFLDSKGKVLTLVSNLDNFSESEYKELYKMRWGIEIKYRSIKHQLGIEKFSGRTVNTVYQDFYASILLYNLIIDYKNDVDEAIRLENEGKDIKYKYQAKMGSIMINLRDKFIFTSLGEKSPLTHEEIIKTIIKFTKYKSVIRPNRQCDRKPKTLEKYVQNLKDCL